MFDLSEHEPAVHSPAARTKIGLSLTAAFHTHTNYFSPSHAQQHGVTCSTAAALPGACSLPVSSAPFFVLNLGKHPLNCA